VSANGKPPPSSASAADARVTILIVNYNARGLLHECLTSLRQHAPGYPVLVVDNASTDGSAAMIEREFPQVRLLRNERNAGFGAANNRALAGVTTELTMLLNSDARLDDDAVGALITTLDAQPDAAVVGCRLISAAGLPQRSARRFPSPRRSLRNALALPDPMPNALASVDYVDGAAMLARTEALREVGGFDERFFLYVEDADLCCRLKAGGWRILYDPHAHVRHLGGGSTERGSRADDRRHWEGIALYAAKHFGRAQYVAFVVARALEISRQCVTGGARGILGDASARRRCRTAWRFLCWHRGLLRRPVVAIDPHGTPARLPVGYLDEPGADAKLDGPEVTVSGWVLMRGGLEAVEVRRDGDAWTPAVLGCARPDLTVRFPALAAAAHAGFSARLTRAAEQKNSPFTVEVRCRGRSGQVFALPARRVAPRSTAAPLANLGWTEPPALSRWGGAVARARFLWDLLRTRRLPRSWRDVRSSYNKWRFHLRSRGRFLDGLIEHERRAANPYARWREVNDYRPEYRPLLEQEIRALTRRPVISIVMPVYRPDRSLLERAVASVREQVYPQWELCLVDDGNADADLSAWLTAAAEDPRLRVATHTSNRHISAATNTGAALATGEFLLFLDQDDELAPDALFHLATRLVEQPDLDVVYSDEDKIDARGQRAAPHFKPDWDPELLLVYMYFGHFFSVRRELFHQAGGMREGLEGAQDFDLALRLTEHTDRIGHIPLVLYHWRAVSGSTAAGVAAKPYSVTAGERALNEALVRRDVPARAEWPDFGRQAGRVVYRLRFDDTDDDAISIIIPTRNQRALLERCVRSIEKKTTYRNYRIVIVDDESDDPAAQEYLATLAERKHRVIRCEGPRRGFNFSRLINRAVEAVDTPYVLFLNNDTEIVSPDWLQTMLGFAKIPGVGVVGARLLFPDGRVQHAGVLLFRDGPTHAFLGLPQKSPGYMCYPLVARDYAAVTGACMLTPRALFLAHGGFDEAELRVNFQDIDYCLRVRRTGLRSVYAGTAELLHHEHASRQRDVDPHEAAEMRRRWGDLLSQDPHSNPNLSRTSPCMEVGRERTRPVRLLAPPRVALFAHDLASHEAGLSFLTLARALRRQDWPITLFAAADGGLRPQFEALGVEVRSDLPPAPGPMPLAKYRDRFSMLHNLLCAGDFDIVAPNGLDGFGIVDAARALGLPAIWYMHEDSDWREFFARFEGAVMRRGLDAFASAEAVVFVAGSRRALLQELDREGRFHVIHNGPDLDAIASYQRSTDRSQLRARLGIPDDAWLVGAFGALSPRPGQIEVVAAANRVLAAHPQLPLHVAIVAPDPAGSADEYSQQLAGTIDAGGHPERFHLLAQTDTFSRFHVCDAFVCAAHDDGLPHTTLAAMGFGLPIVTTPGYAVREALRDQVSALFVAPGNANALAAALFRLWQEPGLARTLGHKAYDTAVWRYDIRSIEREQYGLFDRLLPRVLRRRLAHAAVEKVTVAAAPA
jgi:GT2 family glycosyltransferase